MAREISLSKGKVAIVDDQDYEWLSQWKWYATSNDGSWWYAVRNEKQNDGRIKYITMHRKIMGEVSDGIKVDHRNGDGLDNRRDNLRIATNQQNLWNQRTPKNNTSGYKGVCWVTQKRKWRAQIGIDGKNKFLGCFNNAEDAARVYDDAALRYYGEFACLNFPGDMAQQVSASCS